ncbi:acyl-CoA thioesterase FadM [Streptomyces canus]|uniref:Acyl-CoA thioesterase FadM n=1 Tax=Streptomyces canus TaxID=58343 RepID=A0AAW8F6N2_9ACTN|nr:acyl-CoA thioesterase FadM [Streptomyces canus]MDQ0904916.1 acyl-CoA thioesterase FadM [Streptomyces canus]MDQ1065082.1 acyl-CoA thioesterase FadM [Streptomyces canus]
MRIEEFTRRVACPRPDFAIPRVGDVLRSACRTLTDVHAVSFVTVSQRSRFIEEVFGECLEMACRYLAEVHPGDVLYPTLIVTALELSESDSIVSARATICNQKGELVLSGQCKYHLARTSA